VRSALTRLGGPGRDPAPGPGAVARSYDPAMDLAAVQARMEAVYGARDRARGIPATVAWLAEEVGELAKAARKGTRDEQLHELGDVLAWLASLANQLDCSLTDAFARYAHGCPRCTATPCTCPTP